MVLVKALCQYPNGASAAGFEYPTHKPPPAAVGLLRGTLRFRRPATRTPDLLETGSTGIRTAGRPSPPSTSRPTWPTLYKFYKLVVE